MDVLFVFVFCFFVICFFGSSHDHVVTTYSDMRAIISTVLKTRLFTSASSIYILLRNFSRLPLAISRFFMTEESRVVSEMHEGMSGHPESLNKI